SDGSFTMPIVEWHIVWEKWGAAPEGILPKGAICLARFPSPSKDPALTTGSTDLTNHVAANCRNSVLVFTFDTIGRSIRGRVTGFNAEAWAGRAVQLTGETTIPGAYAKA